MKINHRSDSNVRKHFILTKHCRIKLKSQLVYAGNLEKKKGWKDENHSHNYFEMILVLEGAGKVMTGNNEFVIKKGDLIVYNQGIIHSEYSSMKSPLKIHFIGINKLQIKNLPLNYILPQSYGIVFHTDEMFDIFKNYFQTLINEIKNKKSFYSEITQYITNLIIVSFYRLVYSKLKNNEITEGNDVFNAIKNYLDNNYLKKLTLDIIAKNCFASKYYISHLFMNLEGVTIGNYILNKRIEYSKTLLLKTNLSINEISQKAGFNNFGYFCRAFKKINSITPLKYRKSLS